MRNRSLADLTAAYVNDTRFFRHMDDDALESTADRLVEDAESLADTRAGKHPKAKNVAYFRKIRLLDILVPEVERELRRRKWLKRLRRFPAFCKWVDRKCFPVR